MYKARDVQSFMFMYKELYVCVQRVICFGELYVLEVCTRARLLAAVFTQMACFVWQNTDYLSKIYAHNCNLILGGIYPVRLSLHPVQELRPPPLFTDWEHSAMCYLCIVL